MATRNPPKVVTATAVGERSGPLPVAPLTMRIAYPKVRRRKRVVVPAEAARIFVAIMDELPQEEFWTMLFDEEKRPLGTCMAHRGGLATAMVDPRVVFRPAVILGASSMVVAHNHPSGDPTPSVEDHEITERLRVGGELLGVEILDHLVVGSGTGGVYSMLVRKGMIG